MEIYKDIIGFENYQISNYGNVYSKKTKKVLKNLLNTNGYLKVHLQIKGKMKNLYIHRLVGEYFVENPNNFKYIDHIDRNKLNNYFTNLRWCTASENIKNIGNKKRYSISRAGHKKEYTRDIINKIMNMKKDGIKVMEISRLLNIPRQSITTLIKRHRDEFGL